MILRVMLIAGVLFLCGCEFCFNIQQPVIVAPGQAIREIVEKSVDKTTEAVKPVVIEPVNPCDTCTEIMSGGGGS